MKVPSGFYYSAPKFPSMLVHYDSKNEFYYSGSVGFLALAAFETWRLKAKLLAGVIMFFVVWEAQALLSLHAHYSIGKALHLPHF